MNNNNNFPSLNSTIQQNKFPKIENNNQQITKNSLKNLSITKIAIINIHTLNKEKLIFMLDAMKSNDIDIYELVKTNLSIRTSKIWQQQFSFYEYFEYFDYSQQEVEDKAQKKNVRLIQVYINANKKERTQIEELYKYVKDIIDKAKQKNMEIIIMVFLTLIIENT
ncbi:hypothetical protein RhiirA4_483025 [Rhizophagus irregularis]|uniref:Uncharacterized protein n=1 Tax=Rhizophagus irregularis TaxID=588596 RepID=A0A2I1HLY3_9GLOM|nr:hypothetical protein RhiirA4_483025 [Rhizophagus irregularis]